jgi:hypothetical protein
MFECFFHAKFAYFCSFRFKLMYDLKNIMVVQIFVFF